MDYNEDNQDEYNEDEEYYDEDYLVYFLFICLSMGNRFRKLLNNNSKIFS